MIIFRWLETLIKAFKILAKKEKRFIATIDRIG